MYSQLHSTRDPHSSRLRKEVALLGAILVSLVTILVLSPAGVFGFMHSVGETNLFSIAIIVSLIGILFVLLNRIGFSFGYVEEINSRA